MASVKEQKKPEEYSVIQVLRFGTRELVLRAKQGEKAIEAGDFTAVERNCRELLDIGLALGDFTQAVLRASVERRKGENSQ